MLKQPLLVLTAACSSLFAFGCAPRTSASEPTQVQSLQVKSFALINEEITNTIAQQMQLKCNSLFATESGSLQQCNRAATQMAQFLDFNYIRRSDGQGAFVFMQRRLNEMLTDRTELEFISKLTIAAEDALYLNKKLDLWEFTLRNSNNRVDVATERLAVLVQDGAETAAQIKYLLVAQHPQALQLAQMISTLEEALKQGKASAYPAHVGLSRTALYHYYVPRYLAQKLNKAGTEAAMAARLPFMFNSSYEMHQIQKAQNPHLTLNHKPVRATADASPELKRFLAKWNSYDELYSDLLDHLGAPFEAFDARGQDTNMEDLFLGYVGCLDGVAGARPTNLNFAGFSERFSLDPKAILKYK
jgi:hypothetical protein